MTRPTDAEACAQAEEATADRRLAGWTGAQQRSHCDCRGFKWIGQAFSACDGCGHPFWLHTHEERLAPGAHPFGPASDWIQMPISQERKVAVRAKWDR